MQTLGIMIRRLRVMQARTLQDIADICGFTPSLLSKIERGKTVPPISTLTKIADALGVRVSSLLDGGREIDTVFETSTQGTENLITTSKGYSFHAFAQERGEKAFQPYLFVAERNKVTKNPLSHRGEEFVYMLEGEMAYRVGIAEYTLRPGDSLYFDSSLEHDLRPITKSVKYLAVFTEQGDGDSRSLTSRQSKQGKAQEDE